MSEDAPVNIGAAALPGEAEAHVAVRRIQNKLHCWAGADRARRFDDLYNLVCDLRVLTMAWERVAGNRGARTAGIDQASVAWIESRYGVQTFLHEVRDRLRSRTFVPTPVRQVMIPKASGKLRALGIPTVTDRVVQAALKIVLEPIFEADFQSVSYGFRPNRRAQDAIAEIHHFTTKSYEWVLEADIEACFDNIDHAALMDRVRRRIGDKRVLALVKSFLKAGVLTTAGTVEGTVTGTPQGGLCKAEHNPPNEQCWLMRSADLSGLVSGGSGVERCALRVCAGSKVGEPVDQSEVLVPFGQVVGDDVDVGGFEGCAFGFGGGAGVDLGGG